MNDPTRREKQAEYRAGVDRKMKAYYASTLAARANQADYNSDQSFYDTAPVARSSASADANKTSLTVAAIQLYNDTMQKIFGVNTQLFGPIGDFNPMFLPVPSVVEQLNVPNVQVPEAQRPRLQNFQKYIAFLTDNGYFSVGGALSGLSNSIPNSAPILNQVNAFIKNMEIQPNGQNVKVTLRDIVQMSTSVKSNPYYCDSMKLFIAILTAVKYINKSITQPDFEFSKPGMFSFSQSSGLQKSFVACSSSSSQIPVGDPVDTNYLNFNTSAFTAGAAAAAQKRIVDNAAAEAAEDAERQRERFNTGGSKSMRRNKRIKRARKTRRRSHKRASKSHKRT